jgi:hypothetical protein
MFSRLYRLFSRTEDPEETVALIENNVEYAVPSQIEISHLQKVNDILARIHFDIYQSRQRIPPIKRKLIIYSVTFSALTLTLLTAPVTFLSILIKSQLEVYHSLLADLNAQHENATAIATELADLSYSEYSLYAGYYRLLNSAVIDYLSAWVTYKPKDKPCSDLYDLRAYYGFTTYDGPQDSWIDTGDLITGTICTQNALGRVTDNNCHQILKTACDVLHSDNATLESALEHFHRYRSSFFSFQTAHFNANNISAEMEALHHFSGGATAALVIIPIAVVTALTISLLSFNRIPVKKYRESLQLQGKLAELISHPDMRDKVTSIIDTLNIPYNEKMQLTELATALQTERVNAMVRHNRRLAFFSGAHDQNAWNHRFVKTAPKDIKKLILDMADLSVHRSRYK